MEAKKLEKKGSTKFLDVKKLEKCCNKGIFQVFGGGESFIWRRRSLKNALKKRFSKFLEAE